jgi:hypothetical protein
MAMSEHDNIRELLALAAADALTNTEEKQVAEHVRSCIAYSNELGAWRPIASWPVFHVVSGRFGSLLEPQFSHTWISFAAFTALGWLAGGVAAVMLAIRQRGERRLA